MTHRFAHSLCSRPAVHSRTARAPWRITAALALLPLGAASAQVGTEDSARPRDEKTAAAIAATQNRATDDVYLRVRLDTARGLVHSATRLHLPPGEHWLRYCTWTPGNHTPSGPIENVVNLQVTDGQGRRLHWDRDPTDVYRIRITAPEGSEHVEVSMTYIASQPNVNSRSSDCYVFDTYGGLNWNALAWYPEGRSHQQLRASLTIESNPFIRPGSFASALPGPGSITRRGTPGDPLEFVYDDVHLARLVDSPFIYGEHFSTTTLNVGEGVPPHRFHVAGPTADSVKVPQWLTPQLEEMCRQTIAVFGPFPRERYEFLILLSEAWRGGLEHAESTFIGMQPGAFEKADKDSPRGGGAALTVIPHEYIHAWCGKLLAPGGLVSIDYHTPAHTEMLWFYEGLTSYYDEVIAVRSGMTTADEFRQNILESAVAYEQRAGRLWRSVEDTARAARHLRAPSRFWSELRRGQDYYGEAALFWMEADVLIRTHSAGARSLDDFCRSFFDVPVRPVGDQATCTRDDVVRALRELCPDVDWDALIRERIERPVFDLSMHRLLNLAGHNLVYTQEQTAFAKEREAADTMNLRTSLGFTLNADGEVTELVPGSPADEALIGFGDRIIGVDEFVYSKDRLKKAVKASADKGSVTLLVREGEKLKTVSIPYNGGLRYPRLEPIQGKTDWLSEIAKPRTVAP